MSVDKLVDSTQLDANLTSVANAIRSKGGTSAQMAFPAGFVSAVQAIPTGVAPTGTKQISITQNGTTTEDVTNYASAEITVNVSGGETIYYTTYTLTGDTTLYNLLQSVNYQMHYSDVLVIIRANGTNPPTSGSYTLNNYQALFFDNRAETASKHYYIAGKVAPDSLGLFITNENDTSFSITNGILRGGNPSSSSCVGTTGDSVVIVEIPINEDKYRGLA